MDIINNDQDQNTQIGHRDMPLDPPPYVPPEITNRSRWQWLFDLFTNHRIETVTSINELHNDGNPITIFIDRYIKRRHCPYCFGFVTKRIYRERSRLGNQARVSNVSLGLPNFKNYVCPHCHNELPGDFFQNNASSIALVGGKDSGKTTFITVFCDLLLNKPSVLGELGIFGSILNEDGMRQFENNRWMLMDQNTTLNGTYELQRPIVVKLQSKFHKKSTYITLIDSPGEQFEELITLIDRHPNLQYANGIIFLMNPLDIAGIAELIEQGNPGSTPSKFERISVANFNLVENLYKLYVATKRIEPNQSIKVPTVFCLSRADILEDIAGLYIPTDSDAGLIEVEDILEEMELVATDMRDLLEETDKRLLNLMDKSFKNYNLFPVSPLGKSPIGQAGRQMITGGVEPKGILQPFIWLLRETGFIKKV